MKEGFRQSAAWLHTWAGLLLGWLLFAMFVTGTAAYFQEEITRWMKPEVIAVADPVDATQAAIRYLETKHPDAVSWYIGPPTKRNPTTSLFWQSASAGDEDTSATLGALGHPVTVRDSQGGYFLYRFHYDLHYIPVMWARYLVGIAAMAMLIAILSGIITHKKIFADFFMLRFGKGQRSWLDAHNVTAVFALPFYLMITYTGLVTLATQYMPWGIAANYKDSAAFFQIVFPGGEPVERTGNAAPLAPIAPLMRAASARWGGDGVGYVQVSNPGDRSARITLSQDATTSIAARGGTIVFDGVTGRILKDSVPHGGALATESVMIGLHAGRYAGWGLRWLYFLSGVGGTIMVGTGLILWTVKRRAKLADPARPHFGFRLVEKLNVGAIAGLPAGIACYFLANRLLPLMMAARAQWEIHCLFIAWGTMLLWAIVRPTRRAWIEGLAATSALFAAVPIVNAAMVPRNMVQGLFTGDWLFVAFDLSMLILAVIFGFASRKMASIGASQRARRRSGNVEAIATI